MKTVQVTTTVEIAVDESKFTPEFMEEFRESFYPFDSIDDHIKHLAQLHVNGVANWDDTFIEGYGKACDMGIKFNITSQDEDIKPQGYIGYHDFDEDPDIT